MASALEQGQWVGKGKPMDDLIHLLDQLGEAHEGYITAIGREERALFEMGTSALRKQITDRFELAIRALKFARPFVAEELERREALYTIGGDYSTLAEEDGGACGETLACLKQIDAALNGKDKPC
jgi:hypothetical protein